MKEENILEVKNLSKAFTTHHLDRTIRPVEDVSFDVKEGDFLGIVGRSGSGKSTIIKCIYRTYLTSQGSIYYRSRALGETNLSSLDDRSMIHLRQSEIGYVSQFLDIMPRTTSLELVINSLLEAGADNSQAEERARETLSHFDISEDLWDSYPNTFSGGEKLRLNISTAIVKEPRLLLLDEPTASLDEASKVKVRQAIEKLKGSGTTMVGIFHDLEFMEGLVDATYDLQERKLVRT